jgi:hypothetical protein
MDSVIFPTLTLSHALSYIKEAADLDKMGLVSKIA